MNCFGLIWISHAAASLSQEWPGTVTLSAFCCALGCSLASFKFRLIGQTRTLQFPARADPTGPGMAVATNGRYESHRLNR